MPEQYPSYPEPTPREDSAEAMERLERTISQFAVYPDDSVVVAPEVAIDQELHFNADDVAEEVEWAQSALPEAESFEVFLTELIKRVTDKLPGDASRWQREFLGRQEPPTVREVSEAGAANCFVRSVAFAGILQQIGIDAKAVQGHWVQTTRQNVRGSYPSDVQVEYRDKFSNGVKYLKGEEGEYHAFTIIQYEGEYYFADPALWVKHEDGSLNYPLVKKTNLEELLTRDVKFPLENGMLRHYVFKSAAPLTADSH